MLIWILKRGTIDMFVIILAVGVIILFAAAGSHLGEFIVETQPQQQQEELIKNEPPYWILIAGLVFIFGMIGFLIWI